MQTQATPCRGMADIIPAQKATKKETFETLCKDFKIDDKVYKLFENSAIENLEEFRFYDLPVFRLLWLPLDLRLPLESAGSIDLQDRAHSLEVEVHTPT